MRFRICLLLSVSLLFLPASSLADDQHSHAHFGDMGKVGTVHFPTSCKAAVQAQFERAVAMLHSFWYEEAEKAFRSVADADPGCAMAQWGVAMSMWHPLWPGSPDAETLKKGLTALEKARTVAHTTPRERDYIDAIAKYYEDSDKLDHRARALAYEHAMQQLAERNPKDREASIFYALALLATAPPTDKTYVNARKAGDLLEKVLAEQPDHPGVAHYIIHSYDNPVLAGRAVAAARSYAKIAPSVPHAQHMPSHIFIRLGLWQEAIASNLASAAAARDYEAKVHMDTAWDQRLHALDYLEYSYLQIGEEREARKVLEEAAAVKTVKAGPFVGGYALAAIPARFAVEQQRWAEAAALPVRPDTAPAAEAITRWARALGAARTGNTAAAQQEITRLEELKAKLEAGADPGAKYWAGQVEAQRRAAAAWLAHAQGNDDDALKLMRAAVELEESMEKHPVTPGPVLPAREQLADLLLETKQPALALVEYETSLKSAPNRFHAIYGAAQAAEAAKRAEVAKGYYARAIEVCAKCSPDHPSVRHAQRFLAAQ